MQGGRTDQIDDAWNQALVAKADLVEDLQSTSAYTALRRHEIIGTAEVTAESGTFMRECSLGETRGGPDAPMSKEMGESKFMEAVSQNLMVDQAQQLLAKLRQPKDATDVNQLLEHGTTLA